MRNLFGLDARDGVVDRGGDLMMMTKHRSFLLLLMGMLVFQLPLFARTFYVDFAEGDNTADGLAPERAWKHAPFDQLADGQPSEIRLEPGDTVIFKGGVLYHGELVVEVSGDAGRPITLDGNTAGTFGEGPAILDGGRAVTGWQQVRTPEQVRGNPLWARMFTAVIDLDLKPNLTHRDVVLHRKSAPNRMPAWQRVILIDGAHGVLPIAQTPKPDVDFYPDLPGDFYKSPHRLEPREGEGITLLTDAENLTSSDADAYTHMTLGVHGGNNHVYFANVLGFDPETRQLQFPYFRPATYATTRWALYNAPELIQVPGEWSIQEEEAGRARIFILPRTEGAAPPENIAFAQYRTGIEIRGGQRHLHLRGLVIQRYSGGGGGIHVARSRERAGHIIIEDCTVRWVSGAAAIGLNYCDDLVVRNSVSHHCPGWTTSIFASRVNRFVFENNHFFMNSGSGIRHYECKQGVVRNNAILQHNGMHASGINIYEGCEDLTVEGNTLHNAITLNRNAERIVIRNNVVDGLHRLAYGAALWPSGQVGGRDLTDILIENNTFVNLNPGISWFSGVLYNWRGEAPRPTGLTVRNNIMDRLQGRALPGQVENNIFLMKPQPEGLMEGNYGVFDPVLLFQDAASGDYRRRPEGPHPGVGADIPAPRRHEGGLGEGALPR